MICHDNAEDGNSSRNEKGCFGSPEGRVAESLWDQEGFQRGRHTEARVQGDAESRPPEAR